MHLVNEKMHEKMITNTKSCNEQARITFERIAVSFMKNTKTKKQKKMPNFQ